jgi:hypothetical protein
MSPIDPRHSSPAVVYHDMSIGKMPFFGCLTALGQDTPRFPRGPQGCVDRGAHPVAQKSSGVPRGFSRRSACLETKRFAPAPFLVGPQRNSRGFDGLRCRLCVFDLGT